MEQMTASQMRSWCGKTQTGRQFLIESTHGPCQPCRQVLNVPVHLLACISSHCLLLEVRCVFKVHRNSTLWTFCFKMTCPTCTQRNKAVQCLSQIQHLAFCWSPLHEQDLLDAGVCIVQLPQRLDTCSEDAGYAEPSSITQQRRS